MQLQQSFVDSVTKTISVMIAKSDSLKWPDLVDAVKDSGLSVDNWMNVRAVLQTNFIDEGVLTRTENLRAEEYYVNH
jgi:hypothetical protein